MTGRIRRGLFIVVDFFLINAAALGAYLLRFDGISAEHWQVHFLTFVPATLVRLLANHFFGLYHQVWKYASVDQLIKIAASVTVGSIVNIAMFAVIYRFNPPRSIVLLTWLLNIFLLGGARLAGRISRAQGLRFYRGCPAKRVLIVGAGDAGALVARELRNHYDGRMEIIGFIDDDPQKLGQRIFSRPILGSRQDIPAVAQGHSVDEIIISMPSVARKVIREIVEVAQKTGVQVKILPGVYDLIEGNVTVSQIRQVELEDLLGREPVEVDLAGISSYLAGKVVLVTGAGGSIGSELCRQVLNFEPKKLLLLDRCENGVYEIEMELKAQAAATALVSLVKDIQDERSLDEIFSTYKPAVVFHAAAHKHVPLMETNPEEAIKNNVLGTYRVALAAKNHKAEKFVLVSTDKAVNPTSIMGASKRIAEMIVQYLDTRGATEYMAVRFGNVLGSRGSVVPLFKKQILAGGPVTVTHEEMLRYFMTIPEAVQLIIQTGALGRGGEVFVLDMGEPVRIMDLAKTLIRLSGFEPYKDIDIKITGMRPGEKLYEELLTADEKKNVTIHERIFVAEKAELNEELIKGAMQAFSLFDAAALPADLPGTVAYIQKFLPDFQPVTNAKERALAEAAAGKD